MILVIAGVALMIVWFGLMIGRARLQFGSHFEAYDTKQAPDRWPSVSVIIPARNEADVLRFTLPTVFGFYYPQVEIVLVDDCSEDGTAKVAQEIAGVCEARDFRVLAGTTPPSGWRGKLWALEQGVRATKGEWMLLADADIRFHPQMLRDLMRMTRTQGYQMASLMALLRAETLWDRLLLPAFLFFFHLLYPFHQVRNTRSRTAAAAGGCMLIERETLLRAGGVDAIRSAWIDDLALARAVKSTGAKIYLGATVQAISFRRYGTLKSLREMVARSAFTQLNYSWLLVVATLLGLAIVFGGPALGGVLVSLGILAVEPLTLDLILALALGSATGFMILSYAPVLRIYGLPIVWALTLPGAALVYGMMTVESAVRHTFGKGASWKDRSNGAGEITPGRS